MNGLKFVNTTSFAVLGDQFTGGGTFLFGYWGIMPEWYTTWIYESAAYEQHPIDEWILSVKKLAIIEPIAVDFIEKFVGTVLSNSIVSLLPYFTIF